MSNQIKYGILGAGHLGNYHAKQLKRIKDVNLVGIFDINRGKYRTPMFFPNLFKKTQ